MNPASHRLRSWMIRLMTRLVGAAAAQCREAARLTSESRERPLTRREKISIRVHNRLCPECAAFEKQLELMGRCAKADPATPCLSEAEKKRLVEALRSEGGNPSPPTA